jgi:uncharacterized membrane protein
MTKDKDNSSNAKIKHASKLNKINNNNCKICAILAYLIIGIIWYFVDEKMKNNSLTKFHTKQMIVLLIVDLIFIIATSILRMILDIIPFIGGMLMTKIWLVISIGIFVLWVIGIINAVNEVEKPLPIIGHLANKLTF